MRGEAGILGTALAGDVRLRLALLQAIGNPNDSGAGVSPNDRSELGSEKLHAVESRLYFLGHQTRLLGGGARKEVVPEPGESPPPDRVTIRVGKRSA